MIPAADRFSGFIVGQCLGDALGFLVEGEPPRDCARYAHGTIRTGRLPRRSGNGPAFGQYSDGSQMARELMESYVACDGFDADDFARRIAALFTENRIVGHGRATQEAALRLASGIPWRHAGTPAPAAGNASAMRAGILGLVYGDLPETLVQIVHDQGIMTHADPRCSAGAITVAGAIALASRDVYPDGEAFFGPLRHWSQKIEPTLAGGLRKLEELLSAPKEQVAEAVSHIGLPPGVDSQWRGGISAFVVSSVLWALYAFLKHPDDFALAVALAIEAGGDVDTTAAMTGAMVGARRGLAGIPADLAAHLNDRGAWRRDDLVALALACQRTASRQQA